MALAQNCESSPEVILLAGVKSGTAKAICEWQAMDKKSNTTLQAKVSFSNPNTNECATFGRMFVQFRHQKSYSLQGRLSSSNPGPWTLEISAAESSTTVGTTLNLTFNLIDILAD